MNEIPVDVKNVSLIKGEHRKPEFKCNIRLSSNLLFVIKHVYTFFANIECIFINYYIVAIFLILGYFTH